MKVEIPYRNVISSLFVVYGVISIFLGLVLNQYTLKFFVIDKWAIQRSQIVFLIAGVILIILGRYTLKVHLLNRFTEKLINIFIFMSVFLFFLFCTEVTLAIRFNPTYNLSGFFGMEIRIVPIALEDNYLGHKLNPKLDHSYKINSLGFRGGDFSPTKSSGEVRIFCVGNSITFGWGLYDETATYPYQLQLLLDGMRKSIKYNVINAGTPRYTSLQALRALESKVLKMNPDIIILCIGWNDLNDSYKNNWQTDMSISLEPLVSKTKRTMEFIPAIFKAVKYFKSYYVTKEALKLRVPNPLAAKFFKENLEKIVDICQEHGIKLIILNLPTILSKKQMTAAEIFKAKLAPEIENLKMFQSVIDEVCRSRKVSCILNIFDISENNKGDFFFDHCHPVKKGNRIIAKKIYYFLMHDIRFKNFR